MGDELKPQAPAGEETPQPKAEELGAEVTTPEVPKPETPKPIRTYSEDEWAKRESEKDREAAALRQALAQIQMQSQIAEAQRSEAEVAQKDKTAVEQGLMSEDDAKERQQLRIEKLQVQMAAQRLRSDQESIARMQVAGIIAQKYGVASDDLLRDNTIRTPTDMIEKASSLAQKKYNDRLESLEAEIKALKEGGQQYDSGLGGTGATSTEGKSPMELAEIAYSQPRKRKK